MLGDELNAIFAECGTDKGPCHHYGAAYEYLLRGRELRELKLLELGVAGGGSLRTWNRYLPRATVIGADHDPNCRQYAGPQAIVEIIDHSDREQLQSLAKYAPFDIIIDDGSHQPDDIRLAYDVLWPMLKVGGIYVMEDLQVEHLPLPTCHSEHPIVSELVARVSLENRSGLGDRITIFAGELAAFVKVKWHERTSRPPQSACFALRVQDLPGDWPLAVGPHARQDRCASEALRGYQSSIQSYVSHDVGSVLQ
jgi:Methyltransferase domain